MGEPRCQNPDPYLSPSSRLVVSELGPVFLHHPSESGLVISCSDVTDLLDELLNLDRLALRTLAADREDLVVAALVRDTVAEADEDHRSNLEAAPPG